MAFTCCCSRTACWAVHSCWFFCWCFTAVLISGNVCGQLGLAGVCGRQMGMYAFLVVVVVLLLLLLLLSAPDRSWGAAFDLHHSTPANCLCATVCRTAGWILSAQTNACCRAAASRAFLNACVFFGLGVYGCVWVGWSAAGREPDKLARVADSHHL